MSSTDKDTLLIEHAAPEETVPVPTSSAAANETPCRRFIRLGLIALFGTIAAFIAGAASVSGWRGTDLEEGLAYDRVGSRADKGMKSRNNPHERIDPGELNAAIHAAARYLVQATDADGQFVYRVYLDRDGTGKPRYNMLRHAGTMYALAQYYERYPNPEVKDALLRQADFLQRESIGPVVDDPSMLAVWSRPDVTGARSPVVAKLGGAGLGLVALACWENVAPGTTDTEDLRRLGRFIVSMQKSDGGFYSKYIPSTGGRSDEWISLYYPGEAVLGLTMLFELDPSRQWLEAAAKGMAFLSRSRAGRENVEADHWALLATQRLLPHSQYFKHIVTRTELIDHAAQISRSILKQRSKQSNESPLLGSFMADGRTCPTATRLEGLQAVQTFLPEDKRPTRAEIDVAVNQGIAFLLSTQVQAGPYVGGIPRAATRMPNELRFKDFNRRASEVRIDYVQHALSALLQYQRRIAEEETKPNSETPVAQVP